MPSRRMIDPKIWKSYTMARLTMTQRLLFIGLFSNADDQGRLKGHPALVRSMIFPLDDIDLETIRADLDAIAETGSILIYQINGEDYIQITGWWEYQSPQWAYPSPEPPHPRWIDKLRYRKSGQVVTENWGHAGGFSSDVPEPLPDSLPDGQGKSLPNALPKAMPKSIVQYSDSIELELEGEGADAPPAPPIGFPDPSILTVKEIRRLELDDEQWQMLGELESQGKNRRSVASHIHAVLERPPPAIKVYQESVSYYPDKDLWEGIDRVVGREPGALEFWGRVIRNWKASGWNKHNINGMLDCFRRGEIPVMRNRNANSRGRDNRRTESATGPPAVEGEDAARFKRLQAERKRQRERAQDDSG